MKYLSSGLAVLLALTWPALSLDMNLKLDQRERLAYANLWGEITQEDGEKFRQLITPALRAGYSLFQVNVFSGGGSANAAMDIASQIRTLRARTIAPVQFPGASTAECWFSDVQGGSVVNKASVPRPGVSWCTCTSACFIVWLGGITRYGNVLGVHRFRYEKGYLAGMPIDRAKEVYAKEQQRFVTYYRDAGVAADVIDRMFATSSTDMYYLKSDQIALLKSTPYLDEIAFDRCGSSPEHPTYAKQGVRSEDPALFPCFRGLLKQLQVDGMRAYLLSAGRTPARTP